MFAFKYLACCLCGVLLTGADAYLTDQIRPLSESLWDKVSSGLTLVASSHLASFFMRYDKNSSTLSVQENDFLAGDVSWLTDFGDILDEEDKETQAKAYFRTLDVVLEMFYRRLRISDMDELIDICEKASGSGGSGVLDRSQFVNGFEQVGFRCLPFSYMFVKYNTIPGFLALFENLTEGEFMGIFHDMDINKDDYVDENEMASFWEAGNYDIGDSGRKLFQKLDYNAHGILSVHDWKVLMEELDCRSDLFAGSLDIFEFFQLDLILADVREYPSDKCMLQRA